MLNLLSPYNQNSILHDFLVTLYVLPIIFLIYVVANYFVSFSDEIAALVKKIYYIIWLAFYIIIVNHVPLDRIPIKDSFGVPSNIWTLIVLFIIFLLIAYLLDAFIISGCGFQELSIFGAKFVKQETKEVIDDQHKYLNLFINKAKAENKILMNLKQYMVNEDFRDKINTDNFNVIDELTKLIKQYYDMQNLDVDVETALITDENLEETIDDIACNYDINRIDMVKLKRNYNKVLSYFINDKDKKLLFTPCICNISPNDKKANYLVIVKGGNNILVEEQYMLLNIITLYETEIINIVQDLTNN